MIRRNSLPHLALCALGILVAIGAVEYILASGPFNVTQATRVFIYAAAIVGLNVVSGYAGILSVGHSAFFGLGAYTTAILITSHGWSPEATFPVAFVFCFVAGLVVGLPSLRIRGLYLVMVTLALAVSFPELVDRFADLTGGSTGVRIRRTELRPPDWTGLSLRDQDRWLFHVALVVLILSVIVAHNLRRSRYGLALVAGRDHELAARACGVDVSMMRILAFGLSGAMTGVAGSLFAMYLGTIVAQDSFTLLVSITLLTGLMVGGASSRSGPLIGAVLVVYLPYYTADIGSGQAAPVFFAIALIFIMFVARTGIAGSLFSLVHRFIVVVPRVRRDRTRAVDRGGGGSASTDTQETAPLEIH